MNSLCSVELHPALVTELHGVSAASVVWISSLLNGLIECFFMLFSEVILHPLLVKESTSWLTSQYDQVKVVNNHAENYNKSPSVVVVDHKDCPVIFGVLNKGAHLLLFLIINYKRQSQI